MELNRQESDTSTLSLVGPGRCYQRPGSPSWLPLRYSLLGRQCKRNRNVIDRRRGQGSGTTSHDSGGGKGTVARGLGRAIGAAAGMENR